MGGGSPKIPGPSPEERELQRQQSEMLVLQRTMIEQQNEQNKILLPFIAEQEGFNVTLDPETGMITGITKQDDPLEAQNKEIQTLLNERSLKALRGELPVDPALEEDLTSQEADIRNRLATQLGPGYESSTPGIETLGEFFRTSEILREGARTGQLTLAEQLGITRQQQEDFNRQGQQDYLRTVAVGDPMTRAGAFGQVARGFGQAQVPYIQQRQMQAQASIAGRGQSMALIGAGIGAIGSMFSDPDMKAGLTRISETSHGIPIYLYTRKDTGEEMIGVLSTDVEEIFPGYVYQKDGYDTVQYRELE